MSNKKNSSVAITVKSEKCVKEVKVTNQFRKMMSKVLKALLIILKKRAEDLSEDKWGTKKQGEFEKIFGVKHDAVITIDSEAEKTKAKELDRMTPGDPYIEKRNNITAYLFMKESVDRMIAMCEELNLENKDNSNDIIHGNFINKTDVKKYSASVSASQTLGLNPELYGHILRITIYQNFVCKPLTGRYSQVSTLCHELSHFYRHGTAGEHGGMGTEDIPLIVGSESETGYLKKADNLKKEHSQYVFKSAYNIEQYFELELSNEEILEIEKDS